MPHRCQKWESPNLSSADSRQSPPAGIEPCPAVIWGSSAVGSARDLGSRGRRFESGLSPQRVSASCNGYRLRQSGTGSCMSQHTIWVFPPAATGGGMVPYLNWQESAAHNRGHLGSTPSGTTNAKAMCGAWLGAYALPGRLDPANQYLTTLRVTPRKDGAAAGGIPLPSQPCDKPQTPRLWTTSNGATPLGKW